MSSILTNTSAMTALQTLRGINADLSKTQDMISTGKRVATAKDNAAIFAISKVMESDVAGFKAISESLSLGASTIAVASNASNQVGELLTEIKSKIVAANEGNVDRTTIQNEIDQLSDQIRGVVGGAQFNGLNLLSNSGEDVDVLASLDRGANGSVTSSSITVNGRDFTEQAGTYGSGGLSLDTFISATDSAAVTSATGTISFTGAANVIADGESLTVTVGGRAITVENNTGGNFDQDQAASALAEAINDAGIEGLTAAVDTSGATGDVDLTYAGTNALIFNENAAALTGQITGAVGASPASLAATSATTSTDAGTGTVTLGGTANAAIGEEVTVTFGTETITFALSAAAANTEALEDQIVADFNALDETTRLGITLAEDDSGANPTAITVTNNSTASADFSINLSGVTGTSLTASSISDLGAATAVGVNYQIGAGTVTEGDSFRVTIGGTNYDYIAGRNESINDVAYGLQSVIAATGPSDVQVSVTESTNSASEAATLVINSSLGRSITGADNTGGTSTGDLYGLSQIDVTTDEGASAALSNIESLISTVTRAQADFGASERRVELQSNFMSSLIDSFKAGIGALVDTDMEAASARLQALQVQQQLAVQSLSIANQAPQTILSLFR